MASARAAFSSSVPFGIENTFMILANAAVSSSTSFNRRSMMSCPFTAWSENSFQRSSQPRLCAERLATIAPRAAASAPMYADTEPPPGAADSDAVSLANPLSVMRISLSFSAMTASSSIRNSMTFSLGLNGFRSLRPNDLAAIFMISSSLMPSERCCFSR